MKIKSIISLLIISHFSFSQTVFNKMADFRNFEKVSVNYPQLVTLLGYYSPNDGAYGQFLWVDTSTKADNGGTIIKPNTVEGNGRYERIDEGFINVLWFGAKRDNSADASVAINNAISSSVKYRTNWGLNSYGAGKVIIPPGIYKMQGTIVIRTTVTLEGTGAGMFPYQETQLRYDGNITGIDIKATSNGYGARMVILKNMYLRNFGASTDSTKDGLNTNTRIFVENCGFDNYGGNGISIVTNDSGNANNCILINVTCYYNAKNGLFYSGNESNNIGIYSSNFQANGMCGKLDNSFLGNIGFNNHVSSNGLRAATGYNRSWCKYNGKIYQAIYYTNHKGIEPTVNPNWKNYWIENSTVFGPTGVQPADWNIDSTYYITGAYVVSGSAGTHHEFGSYSEGGEGANKLNQFSALWGGDHGAIMANKDMIYLNPNAFRLQGFGTGMQVNDGGDTSKSYVGMNNTFGVEIGSKKANHSTFQQKYDEASRTLRMFADNSSGNMGYQFIGKGFNPSGMGRSSLPKTGMVAFPYFSGYFLGDINNGSQLRNVSMTRSGPPTTGVFGLGDFCLYMGTSDSTLIGYRCIIAGSPGTWKALRSAN